ncbi:hypothetical protein HYALB_00004044 [Hymenoscyphus albidus]|uniref:Uncharacterized protein n=1 Tax=Hymenoscyphus albidus TaxID=595503 RepID=A0A9N9M2W7_9HELO|nr:hypothetical protein HYALB_00004044 [Hymenoscyphus albidus]
MLGIFAASSTGHDRRDVDGKLYCDYGTEGNGDCEANGLGTFCCKLDYEYPEYVIKRATTVVSKNLRGTSNCTAPQGKVKDEGLILCAPNN